MVQLIFFSIDKKTLHTNKGKKKTQEKSIAVDSCIYISPSSRTRIVDCTVATEGQKVYRYGSIDGDIGGWQNVRTT